MGKNIVIQVVSPEIYIYVSAGILGMSSFDFIDVVDKILFLNDMLQACLVIIGSYHIITGYGLMQGQLLVLLVVRDMEIVMILQDGVSLYIFSYDNF